MVASIIRARQGRRVTGAVVLALAAALALTSCGASPKAKWHNPGEVGAAGGPLKLAITSPKPKAENVPTSTEIGLKLEDAEKLDVTLTSSSGKMVKGELREDKSAWVPARQLEYGATYRATITAVNKTGGKVTKKTTFTTMSAPGRITGAGFYLFDGQKVGVGMPVVLEFNRPVKDRAAVEKRFFVKSDPPAEGAWHWFNDSQAHYRPKEFWKPGTTLSVRIAIGGFPFGDGWYGKRDRTAENVVVGEDVRIDVANKTKRLTVTKNGETIKTMPVSLGKAKTPSSSGNLVVMGKQSETWFDSSTYGVPVNSADGYRTKVYYAMRLTWGGEFIHAAPWSVADQGRRNVSHGCVNLSTKNARHLFNLARIGTPVTVRNTETRVGKGDGWTGWDMDWETYQSGSALKS
ncbi:MAG: L,D-transpeptidase family protein [Micromonosporaceae bacterium]|nr:L,D-transpeptidase family protein [Micromonosporaceae bacterium]